MMIRHRPRVAGVQRRSEAAGQPHEGESELTTLEDATVTPVVLGGAGAGPTSRPSARDRYWVQPVVTVTVLTAFVAYASWAAFVNKNYYVGRRPCTAT